MDTRDYYHVVEIFLDPLQPDSDSSAAGASTEGDKKKLRAHSQARGAAVDVDMYLSAHIERPTVQESTWITAKPGADHIKLYTDLNDWVRSLSVRACVRAYVRACVRACGRASVRVCVRVCVCVVKRENFTHERKG